MTTEDEKQIIANKVIEYSDAAKRLTALETQARDVTRGLQTVEFAFRAALNISDKEKVRNALQTMPSREELTEILDEIDENQATQARCETALKNYGMKLPTIF